MISRRTRSACTSGRTCGGIASDGTSADAHGGRYLPSFVRQARTTLAELARPYLPGPTLAAGRARRDTAPARARRLELPLARRGLRLRRCRRALHRGARGTGLAVTWTPFVPGRRLGAGLRAGAGVQAGAARGAVGRRALVPEYLPPIRRAGAPMPFWSRTPSGIPTGSPTTGSSALNEADLVVVPSRFSAEAIERSRRQPPVAIVPARRAADDGRARGRCVGEIPDDVVRLLHDRRMERAQGGLPHDRGVSARVHRADDRVLLVVKTSHCDRRAAPPPCRARGRQGHERLGAGAAARGHADPPAVRLVTRALAEMRSPRCIAAVTAIVSLARGEGWGLGAFDAAALRQPGRDDRFRRAARLPRRLAASSSLRAGPGCTIRWAPQLRAGPALGGAGRGPRRVAAARGRRRSPARGDARASRSLPDPSSLQPVSGRRRVAASGRTAQRRRPAARPAPSRSGG